MTRALEADFRQFSLHVLQASNAAADQTRFAQHTAEAAADLDAVVARFGGPTEFRASNADLHDAASAVVAALRTAAEQGNDGMTAAERVPFTHAFGAWRATNVNPVSPADLAVARERLGELVARLGVSRSGRALLDSLAHGGSSTHLSGMPSIEVTPLSEMNPGAYDFRSHRLQLNAGIVLARPDQAVLALAHELFHAQDNQADRLALNGDTVLNEVRAQSFAATVAKELEIDLKLAHPKLTPADLASRRSTYEAVWRAFRPNEAPRYSEGFGADRPF